VFSIIIIIDIDKFNKCNHFLMAKSDTVRVAHYCTFYNVFTTVNDFSF